MCIRDRDQGAGRQSERRQAEGAYPLQGEVQERGEAQDPYRQAVLGVAAQRRDAAVDVELVAAAGVPQGVRGVVRRGEVAEVVVGERGAELQLWSGLVAVQQVVDGLVRRDPAVVVEDPGHHALRGADRPGVEEHLRLLAGGAGGGEVEEHLLPGDGEHLVPLEEVGVHQGRADPLADGRRRGLRRAVQQRPEERRALRVPRVGLGHRGGEQGVGLRPGRVRGGQVAELLDVRECGRVGHPDRREVGVHGMDGHGMAIHGRDGHGATSGSGR